MERRIEPVDLMVAVGVFATIICGYLLFMASSGTLESAQLRTAMAEQTIEATNPMAAMEWVQPALGQALVENYLLDRAVNSDIAAAAKEVNVATLLAQNLGNGLAPSADGIFAGMASIDSDHAARVQYVLGRSIVVFTSRGVRSGVLSPTLIDGAYNQRMIALTEERGNRMESAYRETREPMFGRTIVAAGQDAVRLAEQVQDRLGKAIVRIVSLQEESQAKGEIQTQLALLTLASIHTEEMADRFDSLARAEQSVQPASMMFSEPRTWPDIPNGLLGAGSIGLIGLFFVGLMMQGARPDERLTIREVPSESAYRKTA